MTYREKWVQDHPGEEFRVGYVQCPSNHGYRAKESVNDCKPVTCTQCWNSKIPEETPKKEGALARAGKAAVRIAENCQKATEVLVGMNRILDSGDRTEFETGAVRDMREGKGRCDLMPLEVVANYIAEHDEDTDWILSSIREFQKDGCTCHLYSALVFFDEVHWDNCYTMLLEVAKHFEEGAKKYGENNW